MVIFCIQYQTCSFGLSLIIVINTTFITILLARALNSQHCDERLKHYIANQNPENIAYIYITYSETINLVTCPEKYSIVVGGNTIFNFKHLLHGYL